MTATDTTVLEAVLRRDRAVVVAALVAVIRIAWIWILLGAGSGMTAMDMASGAPGMASMMVLASWTLGYAGLIFLMWWAMMPAIMLPSAAPILLLFARVNCNEKAGGRPFIPAIGTPDDAQRVLESYWAKTRNSPLDLNSP
jgi:predicted metal-binding membrane protein